MGQAEKHVPHSKERLHITIYRKKKKVSYNRSRLLQETSDGTS
jgi:hypothetical protein